MTDESTNTILRYLIKRLAAHQDTACEFDYPRIEELCHLIQHAMFGPYTMIQGNRAYTVFQGSGDGKVYGLRDGQWQDISQ